MTARKRRRTKADRAADALRTGRPPAAGVPRQYVIQARVTARELAELKRRAKREGLTVSELLQNREKYLGQVVSVRANLREQGRNCTQLDCPDTPDCCNTCGSSLVLSDRSVFDFPSRISGDAGVLRLEKTDWKSSGPVFRCHGDRSKMCCTISGVDSPITANGTFSDKYGLVLENPTLCH